MPGRTLIAAFAIVLVTLGTASAEKVKTNQRTKVFSKPGEQSPVVLKVKSGQNMTVLAKDGRWLKVRVQGRTGYITRSSVDLPDNDEIARNTRRRPFVDGRSTRRGFAGDAGPEDRVGADATGAGDDEGDGEPEADHARPSRDRGGDEEKPHRKAHEEVAKVTDDGDDSGDDEGESKDDDREVAHVGEKTKVYTDRDNESEAAFTAKPDMVLYPTDNKGKWTLVENDEGDAGWVLTSRLDIERGGGGSHKRVLDAGARGGFMFMSQGMRSAGSTVMTAAGGFNPDNYNLGVSALSIALGGTALWPYGKDYMLGGELAYAYAFTAMGGVYVPNGMGGGVNTSISVHNINVRAVAGYDMHKPNGMMLYGRLGYRYQGYMIGDVADVNKNPAKFPSEVFKAPTVGGAISVPKLKDKIGIKASLDVVLAGASITQTAGLEDGKPGAATAKAATLGGEFVYRWKKDMDLRGTYDLNYTSIDFGASVAGNMRGHTGTDVSRTDLFHTITFGVEKTW